MQQCCGRWAGVSGKEDLPGSLSCHMFCHLLESKSAGPKDLPAALRPDFPSTWETMIEKGEGRKVRRKDGCEVPAGFEGDNNREGDHTVTDGQQARWDESARNE